MNKILTIAKFEFAQTVLSKTFLVTILVMPLIMGFSIGVQFIARDTKDLRDKRVAVVDRTGQLFGHLQAKAAEHNEKGAFRAEKDGQSKQVSAKYQLEAVDAAGRTTPELALALSDRIREKDLFAFVIIGADVFEPTATNDGKVNYYSGTPSYDDLPQFLNRHLNDVVVDQRLAGAGLDRAVVNRLTSRQNVERFGLFERSDDGSIRQAERENRLATFLVPFVGLMLLFISANTAGNPMLLSVIEEKTNKLAEVLVASATPFQIMLGKLLAGVAAGYCQTLINLTVTVGALQMTGQLTLLEPAFIFWFFVFQILAMLIYGGVSGTVGAACQEIKDTQNFLALTLPLTIFPFMFAIIVVESPTSTLAQVLSMVPPIAPFAMLVRMGSPPGPQWWELALCLGLTSAFALGCVWMAGRVFRVGLLATGQTPSLGQLLRWIFSKA